MTTVSPPGAHATTRLHGLDTLRAAALGLGVVLHALMPFIPDEPWLVSDSSSSEATAIATYWGRLFRMVLFMLLAGYFGRMMLQRRGASSYLRDRSWRIGLPVAAFWPVAVAPLAVLGLLNAVLRGDEAVRLPEPNAPAWVPELLLILTPGHMWFLVVLLQCVVIVVAARALALRGLGQERSSRIAQRLGHVLTSPAGVGLASLPYLICLLLQGTAVGLIHEPTTILPSASALSVYLGAFLVGWFLHALPGALHRITAQWPAQLAAAVALSVAGHLLFDVSEVPLVVHTAVIGLAGWTWTFGLLGLCLRFLHRENSMLRYLADASYWIYLLHLPLVLGLGIAMADLEWPILVKVGATCAITVGVLLLSYDLFVRSTWLGKWLNGRRRPRAIPWPVRDRRAEDATVHPAG